MVLVFYLFTVLLGLACGSFLNALVFRLRVKKTLWGRSRCVHCNAVIWKRDLVPGISFILLRARCRFCRGRIPWRYPLIEVGTAVLFACSLWFHTAGSIISWGAIVRDWSVIVFLMGIFVYDALYMEIPDWISLPGIFVGLLSSVLLKEVSFTSLVIAVFVGGGFFLVQYALSRGRWVGGGDIRLGMLLGAYLGFPRLLVALLCAYVGGSLIALPLLLSKRATMNTQIPFGMFLAPAGLFALWWGQSIVNWYMSLLGM